LGGSGLKDVELPVSYSIWATTDHIAARRSMFAYRTHDLEQTHKTRVLDANLDMMEDR
jgi:hypothetical protein